MATAPRLMCGICRGPYRKPKILSCFHSFCEVCLESHISKAKPNLKFQCPLCRTAIDIPKGGACSLQNNFYIETTYAEKDVEKEEIENESKLCENCEDDERPEAVKYCEVCQLRICENCVLLHKKLKATKNHELVAFDSINSHKCKEHTCHEHDKEIADRFCFSCEEFICSTCQGQGHEGHTIDDIDKAVGKRKEDVWRNVNESDAYFHVVEQRLKIIQDLETNIRGSEEQAMTELEKRANEMKEEIDNAVKRLSVEIKNICEKELDKLNTVKTTIISAKKNKEITKNWISSADDKEILVTSDMMMRKIMEINSSLPTYIPTISLVTFAQNTDNIFDAKSVGFLKYELNDFPKQKQIEMECVQKILVSSVHKIKFMVSYKDRQVLMAEDTVNGLSFYFINGSKRGELMKEFVISGVDLDNDGNLFASVTAQNKVYKIDRDQKASVFCTVNYPGFISACPDGRVAVMSGNPCGIPPKLIVINRNGAIFSSVQPRNGSFYSLQYIAVCKYTNILAAVDKGNNTVYLFNHKDQIVGQRKIPGVNCIISNNNGHFLLGLTGGVGMIDLQCNLVVTLVCSPFSFQATSLALDTLNQLWVGENGQIFIFIHPDLSVLVN